MLTRKLCREIRCLDDMECEAMELMRRLCPIEEDFNVVASDDPHRELYALILEMVDKTNDILEIALFLNRLPAPSEEVTV